MRPRSVLVAVSFFATLASASAARDQAGGTSAMLPPIDRQRVQDQDQMTWADYRPIPGTNWADNGLAPKRVIRTALVAIDFEDQPFVITLPKGSDPFGNPQVDPIPRDKVPQFYADFWGVPNTFNHGHTIHEYWMEQSRGLVGIPKIDAYGPYRMPRKLFEYGLNEYKQQIGCPTGYTCDGRMEPDADALWMADAGKDIKGKYDVILRIYAGYDETTVWQEFGEMKFASQNDIPAEWGNPDSTKPRWVTTRYVPWTSWLAGAQQWGLSSVRQGESSGTITHELGHNIFRVGDNNNNPYVTPYRRVGTGPWDMMDRGSFNGPGGPHRRWVVPAAEGASMPAGLMLRNRIAMGVLSADRVVQLSREGLAKTGVALARITARAVEPHAGEYAGISVRLDGTPGDRTPPCDPNADPLCAGQPAFDYYSMEVVQRIGYDSFTPDNGVLIAKNKDKQNGSCGYSCHAWVIDAKPADMNMVDFVKPDGTRVMRTIADYRQLNDALFHAGLQSGTEFEWKDEANRLHFYVVDVHRDQRGILSYTLAVRSLDDNRAEAGSVRLPPSVDVRATGARLDARIRNVGRAPAFLAGLHPGASRDVFGGSVFRLSVYINNELTDGARSVDGWSATPQNSLVGLRAGASATVPIFVTRSTDSSARARIIVALDTDSAASARGSATALVVRR